MLFKKEWEVPGIKIAIPFSRTLKVLFSNKDYADPPFTVILSILSPRGGKTALHEHNEGGEFMYVFSGFGNLLLGEKKYNIEPDTFFYAPPNYQHQVVNTSDETMKILCFFSPPVSEEYIENMQKQAICSNNFNKSE